MKQKMNQADTLGYTLQGKPSTCVPNSLLRSSSLLILTTYQRHKNLIYLGFFFFFLLERNRDCLFSSKSSETVSAAQYIEELKIETKPAYSDRLLLTPWILAIYILHCVFALICVTGESRITKNKILLRLWKA